MLILASASPRRQELLRNAAIPFRCSPLTSMKRRSQGNRRAIVPNDWHGKKQLQSLGNGHKITFSVRTRLWLSIRPSWANREMLPMLHACCDCYRDDSRSDYGSVHR